MRRFTFTTDDLDAIRHERYRHPHPRVQQKMEVLWLKSQGFTHEAIARLADVSRRTVQRYLDEFAAGGLEQVRRLPWKGRVNELADHQGSLEDYFVEHPPRSTREAQAAIEDQTGVRRGLTPFIRESVMDVVRTLLEAVALVGVVVLVFLQNWRATLIPMVAVPVAIIGTFAAMAAIGFSLNNVSLFGLVLAIGIVVDDAIVVVENVERWLERGKSSREAARKAMAEVTGPVIAVALVLCAVFVPCAFISGITGQFFRQFAVTIAVSTRRSTH